MEYPIFNRNQPYESLPVWRKIPKTDLGSSRGFWSPPQTFANLKLKSKPYSTWRIIFRTRKWLITMVIVTVSPLNGVIPPLPNGYLQIGLTNHLQVLGSSSKHLFRPAFNDAGHDSPWWRWHVGPKRTRRHRDFWRWTKNTTGENWQDHRSIWKG